MSGWTWKQPWANNSPTSGRHKGQWLPAQAAGVPTSPEHLLPLPGGHSNVGSSTLPAGQVTPPGESRAEGRGWSMGESCRRVWRMHSPGLCRGSQLCPPDPKENLVQPKHRRAEAVAASPEAFTACREGSRRGGQQWGGAAATTCSASCGFGVGMV